MCSSDLHSASSSAPSTGSTDVSTTEAAGLPIPDATPHAEPTEQSRQPETTTRPSPTPLAEVPASDAVAAAGVAYYEALQPGMLDSVLLMSSTRCDSAISQTMVEAASGNLAGAAVVVTVLSVGDTTASVNLNSDAVAGDAGIGAQFRLESGKWLWDGCP